MAEYIEKEALMRRIKEIHCAECDNYHGVRCRACWVDDTLDYIDSEPAADVEKMSDGYHTFADLYEQRLILSAALAKNNPNAWKSKRHEDGSVPFGGGWFIMGFDTDEGCYTYHYELKDWDLFQCEELEKEKPWDGHTSKDVRRLLSIPAAYAVPVVRCWDCKHCDPENYHCDHPMGTAAPLKRKPDDFCSYGERMDGDDDAKES